MTLRRCRVSWDNDGDGHFDESVRYHPDGRFYDADEADAEIARLKAELRLLREALSVSRGQWIHSVNAAQCLAALGESAPPETH